MALQETGAAMEFISGRQPGLYEGLYRDLAGSETRLEELGSSGGEWFVA